MLGALIQPSPSTSPSAAMRSRPTCGSLPLSSNARGSTGRHRSSSLYEVLRVKHTATLTEIKMAYRSLAKIYHPDTIIRLAAETEFDEEWGIHGSDGGEFKEIHDAYATLSDPAARAVYDLTLGLGGRRRRHGHGLLGRVGRVGFRPTRRWETDQCW